MAPSIATAQLSVSYADVAVVVNTNSPGSQVIGAYFMAARNIPADRLITIDAPLSTSITPAEFAPIRSTIEDHLIQHDLVDSINYIVTTLGVPVRIDNFTCDSLTQFSKCSSFDTELALMLGPLSSSMVANGYVANPFAGSTSHHSRSTGGIYLVTRLSGPSVQDVLSLIDRSGPDLPVDPTTAMMVVDINNTDTMPGVQQVWDSFAQTVAQPAVDLDLDVLVDGTSLFLDGLSHVVGYVSLTSGLEPFLPTFDWAPGSMAIEWHSHSALEYGPPGSPPGHGRISGWIGRGATCAVGTVGITYASPWINSRITFERYLDTSYHFNAAESMYAGIPWLSWIYDAIGDPKTSVIWSAPSRIDPIIGNSNLTLTPNPSTGRFTIRPGTGAIQGIRVLDGSGRSVPITFSTSSGSTEISLLNAQAGAYFILVQMRSGGTLAAKAIVRP